MEEGNSYMINDPILITGCARSGTSMTAGVIHYCGAFGGELAGPTRNNKKGMFENNRVREDIVKPLLRGIQADPMGQNPLPDIDAFEGNLSLPKITRTRVVSIMVEQGLRDETDWFYKGAKMCLMWKLWHKAFPKAKWVIVRRDDQGIINSCMKTGFMSKYNDAKGWQSWVDVHLQRFKEMKEEVDYVEIYPKSMINGDFDAIRRTVRWLGLEWNGDKILDFITPALWSNIQRNVKEGING